MSLARASHCQQSSGLFQRKAERCSGQQYFEVHRWTGTKNLRHSSSPTLCVLQVAFSVAFSQSHSLIPPTPVQPQQSRLLFLPQVRAPFPRSAVQTSDFTNFVSFTMPRGSVDLTEETIKEFREAFSLFDKDGYVFQTAFHPTCALLAKRDSRAGRHCALVLPVRVQADSFQRTLHMASIACLLPSLRVVQSWCTDVSSPILFHLLPSPIFSALLLRDPPCASTTLTTSDHALVTAAIMSFPKQCTFADAWHLNAIRHAIQHTEMGAYRSSNWEP